MHTNRCSRLLLSHSGNRSGGGAVAGCLPSSNASAGVDALFVGVSQVLGACGTTWLVVQSKEVVPTTSSNGPLLMPAKVSELEASVSAAAALACAITSDDFPSAADAPFTLGMAAENALMA